MLHQIEFWDVMTQAVEDSRIPELQARQRNIVEAWQQSLAHMFPQIKVHPHTDPS